VISLYETYEYDICPICRCQMEFVDKIYKLLNIQNHYDKCKMEVVAERYYCEVCDKYYDIEIY